VVCYYGCALPDRPGSQRSKITSIPTNMDRLVETLGAESLDWSYKTECCGVSLGITQLPIAMGMSRKVLHDAKAVGAEAVIVACPLCQVNLDSRQRQIEKEYEETFKLPIIYFTQLMGGCLRIGCQDPGPGQAFCGPCEVPGGEGPFKRLMGRHRLTIKRVAAGKCPVIE